MDSKDLTSLIASIKSTGEKDPSKIMPMIFSQLGSKTTDDLKPIFEMMQASKKEKETQAQTGKPMIGDKAEAAILDACATIKQFYGQQTTQGQGSIPPVPFSPTQGNIPTMPVFPQVQQMPVFPQVQQVQPMPFFQQVPQFNGGFNPLPFLESSMALDTGGIQQAAPISPPPPGNIRQAGSLVHKYQVTEDSQNAKM